MYIVQSMMIEKTLASLLSRSAVFDIMLDQNMRESQVGEVDILDVEPETLKQMLEFIYTGQVLGILLHRWSLKRSISQVQDGKYTEELLYAADKYGLIELVIIILQNQFAIHFLLSDTALCAPIQIWGEPIAADVQLFSLSIFYVSIIFGSYL